LATTLYDILEVSASASPESIRASYERLHEHHASRVAGDDDAANRLIALREAYATLSDPALRQAYDRRLAMRAEIAAMPEAPQRPLVRTLFMLLVAAACVAAAVKYQSGRQQQERAAVALRTAELEAQRERDERAAAERAEAQRRADEASERAALERERAYARQVSRELQSAEAGANLQAQRAEQQRLAEERQQRYEAERQLAREKAALRRMEAENARSLRY
jgi:colicin import membrane protein